MKKKFAFTALFLALALVAVSITILHTYMPGSDQGSSSITEQDEVVPEIEHSGDGMPWEILTRHFTALN